MKQEAWVQQCLEKWIIDASQAQKMLAELHLEKKEKKSNRLILALVMLGAIFLWAGLIMFISVNWERIPDLVKIIGGIWLMAAFFIAGNILAYEKKSYPKLGRALIFASALFLAANIALMAQIYHIDGSYASFYFAWLIGVLPMMYLYKTQEIATLWVGLISASFLSLLFEGSYWYSGVWGILAQVFLLAFCFIFLGNIHKAKASLAPLSSVFAYLGRAGLFVCLLFFSYFSLSHYSSKGGSSLRSQGLELLKEVFSVFETLPWLYIVLPLAVLVLYFWSMWVSKKVKSKIPLWRSSLLFFWSALLFCGMAGFAYYVNVNGIDSTFINLVYIVLFNGMFLAMLARYVYEGYNEEKLYQVNQAFLFLWVYGIILYISFFSELLHGSFFFIVGGLLLLGGGFGLEKLRKKTQQHFISQQTDHEK